MSIMDFMKGKKISRVSLNEKTYEVIEDELQEDSVLVWANGFKGIKETEKERFKVAHSYTEVDGNDLKFSPTIDSVSRQSDVRRCRFYYVRGLIPKSDNTEARSCFRTVEKLTIIDEVSESDYVKIFKSGFGTSFIETFEDVVSIREKGFDEFSRGIFKKRMAELGFSELFTNILTNNWGAYRLNQIVELATALKAEGVSKDLIVYEILEIK